MVVTGSVTFKKVREGICVCAYLGAIGGYRLMLGVSLYCLYFNFGDRVSH